MPPYMLIIFKNTTKMPFSGFIPGLEWVLTLLHTLLASVDADSCYFVTAQTLIYAVTTKLTFR